MNRNDFLNMIEDTAPVNRQMIGEVYELIDIFPYFQSAHMLLLKGLHSNEDVKFENQLRNSAIHVGDREVLYWLLKTKLSQMPDTMNQATGHSIMIAAEPDNIEPAGVIFLLDDETVPSEDKVFFMDPGFSLPELTDLLELDLDEDESRIFPTEEANLENPEHLEKTSKKQLQSELIDKFIIANPRIESQKDKTYVSNDDISKPFVEEAGGLVTETLAKIYVNQGYYSKAMDIYEKLSLKFPEKSSYFASQIEKVKEYIKK